MTCYNVVLKSVSKKTSTKVRMIKALKHFLDISSREATDIAENVPCLIIENAPEDVALELKNIIEENGGEVEITSAVQDDTMDNNFIEDTSDNIGICQDESKSLAYLNLKKRENEQIPTFNTFEAPVFKSGMANDAGAPVFTSNATSSNKASIFKSSDASKNIGNSAMLNGSAKKGQEKKSLSADEGALVYKSSGGNSSAAPVFRSSQPQVESAPVFISSGSSGSAPIFRSGRARNSFEVCYYHSNNKAVTTCSNCGRSICESCRDIGKAADGSVYCFDCISAVVQEDVDLAKSKRGKIIGKAILSIILGIVFFVLTFNVLQVFVEQNSSYRILLPLFGVALPIYLPLFRFVIKWTWKFLRWKPIKGGIGELILDFIKYASVVCVFVLLVAMFATFVVISPVVALILAIVDFIRYKKADGLVQRNREILQNLSDHMEYIRVMSEENLTADELANDERMQNNHFAQSVRREGYENASKTIADERQEMLENDKQIKKFIINEYGEAVRVA